MGPGAPRPGSPLPSPRASPAGTRTRARAHRGRGPGLPGAEPRRALSVSARAELRAPRPAGRLSVRASGAGGRWRAVRWPASVHCGALWVEREGWKRGADSGLDSARKGAEEALAGAPKKPGLMYWAGAGREDWPKCVLPEPPGH